MKNRQHQDRWRLGGPEWSRGFCRAIGISAFVVISCTDCAVGPNFQMPAPPAASSYVKRPMPAATLATATPGGEAQRFIVGAAVPSRWWTLYGSPAIDQLVDQAIAGNPSVSTAQAALRQAQSDLAAQRGSLFPSLDLNSSATRQKLNGAAEGVPQIGTFMYNLFNTSVKLSYALDIFGGERRGIEAEAAARDSQRFQLEATYQTLIANVVTSALQYASLRAQIAATKQLQQSAEQARDLVRTRSTLGGAALVDIQLEQANLSDIEASLPPLQQQLAVTESQLAVYLGRLPTEIDIAPIDLETLAVPGEIPVSLPSDLVKQRPDIQAAAAQLHRASAEIGVATANLFPQLNISGNLGYSSTSLSNLLSSNVWSLANSLTQPLFHGGALVAKRRAAIAAYDQSLSQYWQTVVGAFKNVADALNALDNDAQALSAQFASQSAAAESLRLTEERNQFGGANVLEMLTAQQQYQRARLAYVRVLQSRYEDTAALFQSLGGDWRGRPGTALHITEGSQQ